MTKMRAFIFAATAAMAIGFIAAPVQLDRDGFGIDAAAAAGKSGGKDCPPEEGKGNNGWGNGGDPTNPGSPKGATADTKLDSSLR